MAIIILLLLLYPAADVVRQPVLLSLLVKVDLAHHIRDSIKDH